MTRFGVHDGQTVTIDLSHLTIQSADELWDELAAPCGLPEWFGRNLNAWWDTIEAGGISEILDAHEYLKVIVSEVGIFQPGDPEGERFVSTTSQATHASIEVRPSSHLT